MRLRRRLGRYDGVTVTVLLAVLREARDSCMKQTVVGDVAVEI